MKTKTTGWVTVRENIQHPDHPELTGDLCKNPEGFYQMLVYNEAADQFDKYAVPYKWGVKHDPTHESNVMAESAPKEGL